MMKTTRSGSWKELGPWGLLGSALVILTFEAFLARHQPDLSTGVAENWRQTTRILGHLRKIDILLMGSSLVKCGLQPNVIKSKTGLKAHNIALFNGQMASSYFLLRRALGKGLRPRAVLIDLNEGPIRADAIGSRPDFLATNLRQWPELLELRDLFDLAWTARDPDFFAAVALGRLLPSARARHEIRASIVAALQGKELSSRILVDSLLRHWGSNRGGHVLPPNLVARSPAKARADSDGPGTAPTGKLARNRLSAIYTTRFLRLAKSHGLKVIWLLPPCAPDRQADRVRLGVDDQFSSITHAVVADNPNLVVIDGRRSGYDATLFPDGSHLEKRGSTTLSADVADVIARTLAGRLGAHRVQTLPNYRDLHLNVPLEDFSQSFLASQLKGTIRR